jgi:lysophospholipase L1-like esterase
MKRALKFHDLLLVLLLMGTLGIAGLVTGFKPRAIPQPIRYLALGDSYTIGESVGQGERWPMQLRDSLQAHGVDIEWYKVIAQAGWKSRDLMGAITQMRPDKDYNLVSLQIGANDFFQGRSIDEYQQRFQQLLDIAIAHAGGHKERVFVLSIPDYSYSPNYKTEIEQVSQGIDDFNAVNKKVTLAKGIHYIDIVPLSRKGLMEPDWIAADSLHPSARQYSAWVKLLLPTILNMVTQE